MQRHGQVESMKLLQGRIPNAAGGGMMVDYSKMGTETYDQLFKAFRQQGMNANKAEAQANQYMGAAFMKWTEKVWVTVPIMWELVFLCSFV